MKNYVQYHNATTQGPVKRLLDGQYQIYAKKSIQHLLYNRVWLISGHGTTSPKQYRLEYVFQVAEVIDGAPNLAIGTNGKRFEPGIPLNDLPWFKEFLAAQQNFSLGVREIPEKYLIELEKAVTSALSL